MKTSEILTKAQKLIAKGWTQGWFAKSAQGAEIDCEAPTAVCWCATGAINKVTGPRWIDGENAKDLLQAATGSLEHITRWNDDPNRIKQEVLDAFTEAIAIAKVLEP